MNFGSASVCVVALELNFDHYVLTTFQLNKCLTVWPSNESDLPFPEYLAMPPNKITNGQV